MLGNHSDMTGYINRIRSFQDPNGQYGAMFFTIKTPRYNRKLGKNTYDTLDCVLSSNFKDGKFTNPVYHYFDKTAANNMLIRVTGFLSGKNEIYLNGAWHSVDTVSDDDRKKSSIYRVNTVLHIQDYMPIERKEDAQKRADSNQSSENKTEDNSTESKQFENDANYRNFGSVIDIADNDLPF